MDRQIYEERDGWKEEWMGGWSKDGYDEMINGWKDHPWMEGWIDGSKDGSKDGRIDG